MDEIILKPINLILKEKIFEKVRLYDGKPSVTSVLRILKDSDAFERYKAFNLESYEAMLQKKADVGTLIHELIAETYRTGTFKSLPSKHHGAWLKFYTKEGHKRKPVVLEHFVSDDTVGGTLDCIMDIAGEECIIDWKSIGTKLYDDLIFKYKLQLGKYIQLYNKNNGTNITKGKLVIFFSTNAYKILEVNDLDHRAGLYDQVLESFLISYKQRHEIQGATSGVQEVTV